MRKIEKYKKERGTEKQRKRLKALNHFQDEIAKYYYDDRFKKKK